LVGAGFEVSVSTRVVVGTEIAEFIDDLARLRIEVFRVFPYLYQGDVENERRYLANYAANPHSVVVLAIDSSTTALPIIGAATAMPITSHGDNVAASLTAAGIDPGHVFYFGESVLLAAYRKRGIGHAFFDHRQAAAKRCGFSIAAFCAVDRGDNHPATPPDYVPHDRFWSGHGFVRRPDLVTYMEWRDVGDAGLSRKPLVFWLKQL
jgi:GNAT superfamily N-acetyltransferase